MERIRKGMDPTVLHMVRPELGSAIARRSVDYNKNC